MGRKVPLKLGGAPLKRGKVYIVGAGPGDPGLLTIKGLRALKKADVVVYDRLITKAIQRLIPPKAERVYVGKDPGAGTMPQDRVHEVLISKVKERKIVTRLKGGDPFLFGHGWEEAKALQKARIRFEIVPGVTSALAAPVYAGIPPTHRGYASSVAIVAGHEDPTKTGGRVKWEKLATSVDTIIVLMGIGSLRNIVGALINGGRHRETAVAIIEWGTTRGQRTITGTLNDIVEKAAERGVKPPAVVVIGDVVKLRKELDWFGK